MSCRSLNPGPSEKHLEVAVESTTLLSGLLILEDECLITGQVWDGPGVQSDSEARSNPGH